MKRNTSRSNGRHPNRALFGVAALVLLAVAAFSYRQWEQFKRANAEAAQTRDVVDSIDRLLSSVTDAETGQRGFLLTGEDRYLQTYNQALQVIPNQLGTVRRLLAGRANESGNLARLNNLVDQKPAELRQTIDLRRTQGLAPTMTVVLSDQGQRAMDEIRALVAQIRRTELSSEAQASTEGEAAAQTALLAAVAGSLVLLFLFAIGLEPFASPDPQAQRRSWPLRYGVAVLTVVVIVLFRMALTPLMGGRSMPFTLFFPAVWFAAWFGGLLPGALSVVLSALAGSYFFAEPTGSLLIKYHDDQIAMLMLVIVGFGMAFLSRSQQRAVVQAMQAENAERVERQRFETTLASIGDAVIVTDAIGRVTFSNKVALSLTGWQEDEASGKHLDEVFRIVNEYTRATVESPVTRVVREGTVAGLANHTILLARDGKEVPIDDSAAPIRDGSGAVQGAVLVFRDITERRRAEATSHILASIVESSHDAIISKDLNGIITSWNKGAERMLGYSADEIIGQPVSILAAPDRPDEQSEILERMKRGEHVEHYQTVRRTKSGKLIQVSLTVSPLHDASGRIAGASKIMRDITAQAEAQREIAEQRERLRVTLSSIGDAVMATDTAGRVSYLNPVAEQLTGWSSEQAAGRALEEVFRIIDEKSRRNVENPVTKALREGQVVGLANHSLLISRDGKEIAIDDSAAPIKDADGRIMGVVLIFRNISEKRVAEKRLAEQAAELRQTVHLMEGVACFVRDLQDTIVYWNPGAADLYGFSAEEALGRVSHSLLKTEFPAQLNEILAQVYTAGAWDGELLHARRDGGRITVASHWALHSDIDGRPIGILEVNVDITQRKAAEEALRLSNAALLRANEDLNQFAFAASHDLQEPLRMITSYSQLLLKGYRGQLDGEAATCVEFITEGNKRMRGLLSDLLAYIQVAGDGQEAIGPVDLNHVFQTAVKNCRAAIEESSAVITCDNLPTIPGYEPHFVQLFQNLVSNGLKYRSERPPRIHASAKRQDGLWRIAIQDNGIGIAPEYHKQIFGVFKRLHGSTIPGTGIGLAICKRVVERYGGEIWIESQVNRGATFYFTVPAATKGAAAHEG